MLSVRNYKRDDAPSIALIYNQSIEAYDSTMDQEGKSETDVLSWMDAFTARETILILEEEGQILGWGIVKRYSEREGYRFTGETSVYLRRDLVGQRRGLGTMMQQELIERCKAYGYHHLVAKIWADNQISLALHKKFGYELVGIQKEIGYVNGQWQDVAILQLILKTP